MVERWTLSRSAASSMVASTLGYRAGVAPQRAPRMFGENHGERHGEKYEKTPAEQGLPSIHLLLAQVDVKDQKSVGHEHQRRTSHVVGLPMAVEGVSTLVLLVSRPDQVTWWLPWVGAFLLAISLGSTVFLSVPLHQKMISYPSSQIGKKLVATNWPRTISWTLRGVTCLVMCAQTIN